MASRGNTRWRRPRIDENEGFKPGSPEQDREPGFLWLDYYVVPGPYEGIGPRGYTRPDERIREEVCSRLTHHGGVDASNIDVLVYDGEVTLKGVVRRKPEKRMAEDTAWSVNGVYDVINQLHVAGTSAVRVRGAGKEDVVMPGRIKEGMLVVDVDGNIVGKVSQVNRDGFQVDHPGLGEIPFDEVKRTDGEIMLHYTIEELQLLGQHTLESRDARQSHEAPGE